MFILGYHDAADRPADMAKISEDRVSDVVDYLILKGVSRARITGNAFVKQTAHDGSKATSEEINHKYSRVEIYVK